MIGPSRAQVGLDNRFMFLGGSFDHQIRRIEMDDDGMPIYPEVKITPSRPPRPGVPYEVPPEETYVRHRCVSGVQVWWIFTLTGYDPPVSHVVDAYPYFRS